MYDLSGRVALITGATSGIGEATATLLAKAGATVIVSGRTLEAVAAAKERIARTSGSAMIETLVLDLASLQNVKRGAEEVLSRFPSLHILMNIAGVMPVEREVSADGIELNHAVNYFAPVLFETLLLPRLKASAPARVVNISSSLHREGKIDLANLTGEGPYDRYQAYSDSKLMILMHTRALARELEGTGVVVNAAHPGWMRTKLAIEAMSKSFFLARWYAVLFKMRPPEEAAARLFRMVADPAYETVTGAYFGASGKGPGVPSNAAQDDAVAQKLKEATTAFLTPYLA